MRLQRPHRRHRRVVSIHARPHGRAMQLLRRRLARPPARFNPRPASRSGDASFRRCPPARSARFNPRPASRSGDALSGHDQARDGVVSIHARPHGRAMPGQLAEIGGTVEFQSTPGLTVGRCFGGTVTTGGNMEFQSTPGLTVGRCVRLCFIRSAYAGFNPRPASRSGDAFVAFTRTARIICFNPRPASRSGDAQSSTSPSSSFRLFQSTPGLTVGRCLADMEACCRRWRVSIHARPHGRAMRHTCNLLIVLRSVTSFREPALRRNLVAMFCDG